MFKENEMFHNTIEATGKDLLRYNRTTENQETTVLEWFRTYEQSATPSHVWKVVFHNRIPLTSVRRALSNLTNDGELVKTDQQKKGLYGRNEFVWCLAEKYRQRRLF